jgi:hypothetical protein
LPPVTPHKYAVTKREFASRVLNEKEVEEFISTIKK